MTIDEFIEKLPKDGWFLNNLGCLLRYKSIPHIPIYISSSTIPILSNVTITACPIITLYPNNDITNNLYFLRAGKELGLSEKDSYIIADTSDNNCFSPHYSKTVREKLLKHCGLVETK